MRCPGPQHRPWHHPQPRRSTSSSCQAATAESSAAQASPSATAAGPLIPLLPGQLLTLDMLLDRTSFEQRITVLALRVPKQRCAELMKRCVAATSSTSLIVAAAGASVQAEEG